VQEPWHEQGGGHLICYGTMVCMEFLASCSKPVP